MSSDKFIEKYNLESPSCIYKLAWSSNKIFNGQTQSCHRVAPDFVSHENYHNFHNTSSKIEDRILMQNGIWPENREGIGCQYCKKIEEVGGLSDRNLINNDEVFDDYVPKEIKENPKSLITSPTILEVHFNNLCNQSCVYCNSKYSSLWEAEDRKYKTNSKLLKEMEDNKKNYPLMLEAHWQWLKENLQSLRTYNILGGEPLYQKEFEENIDFFIVNSAPLLNIGIFSNLKIEKNKFIKILDKMQKLLEEKKLATITFFCSIDCWGPQAEYIRHGMKLNQWEENFNLILNNYSSIRLTIHSTLTNLGVDTLEDLCGKVVEWNKIRQVGHTISIADGVDYLHPNIFRRGFFKDKIYNIVDNYRDSKIVPQLIGFEKSFDAEQNIDNLIIELKSTLDQLDKRRNTNWKTLWPWLNEYEV